MEPGYCLYLLILTMVVPQASQMEQVVVMLFVTVQQYVKVESLCSRGVFRSRQTRQLPGAVDLKGRLLSCQSY